MSRRLILPLILSLIGVVGAAAQDPEVVRLQRRVAALEARRATLAALIARRDSAALAARHLVVVGKSPLFVRAPGWAAPLLEAEVVRVVDVATARHGAAFHRAQPETLVVSYGPPRGGDDHRQAAGRTVDSTRAQEEFLAARRFDIARMAAARVDRMIGPALLRWIGGRFDGREFDIGRREAVRILLASGPGGAGDRCLGGEPRACVEALERPGARVAELRASLFRFAMDQAGSEGWQRLATSAGGPAEARLSTAAGRSYQALVAEWGESLRAPPVGDRLQMGQALLAFAWSLIGVALFAWRLKWLRV